MPVSYKWLKSFFEQPLPRPEDLAEVINNGIFEVEELIGVGSDTMMDVKVLPDRAHDSLSHNGIAREVSILTGIPRKYKPLEVEPELSKKTDELHIDIEDTNRCPVYAAALVRGVRVGSSPDWLREKLETIGQKSVNNIVDATNYIMFGMGQPLHVFDAKKLADQGGIKIGVRPAKKGEKIAVLGGDEKELDESMTVITDGNFDKPIAIAGVKGGVVAEVDENTTDIVIESAKFHPTITRKAAQALGLRTDASKRFENEIANDLPLYGMQLIVELILKVAGGEFVGYAVHQSRKSPAYKLGISTKEVNKLLGTDLSESDVEQVLTKLQFPYKKVANPVEEVLKLAPTLEGKPYKLGASVSGEAPHCFDCSSLTAWLFAQVGISLPRVSVDQYIWGSPIGVEDLQPGDLVFSNGGNGKVWYETLEFLPKTKIPEGVDHVGVVLNAEDVLHASRNGGKGSVVIERIEESTAFKNIVGYRRIEDEGGDRFVVDVPFERLDLRIPADLIEEIGRVHGYANIAGVPLPPASLESEHNAGYLLAERVRTLLTSEGYTEILTYSLTDMGDVALKNALASDKNHLRSNLADAMKEKLDLNEHNAPVLGLHDAIKMFEIGRVFTKGGEKTHMCIGVRALKKKAETNIETVLEKLGVSVPVDDGIVEFELDEVQTKDAGNSIGIAKNVIYAPISAYPFVLRDIALWTEGALAGDVEEIIRENAGDLLMRIDIFDEFSKDGRMSYAFHLVFQSQDKTLSDEEVNTHMQNVERAVKEKGWEVR